MSTATLGTPAPARKPRAPRRGIAVGGPDSLWETIDGVMVEKPAMSSLSGTIASSMLISIGTVARAQKLGRSVMEVLFKLSPNAKRTWRPDAAFVSYERWPKDRAVPVGEPWEVVPDLAIEVQSPSNLDEATRMRMQAYFADGVRAVWIVYPSIRQVYVYDSPASVRVLQLGDSLDGGTVLPGFSMPLDTLFEDVPVEAS